MNSFYSKEEIQRLGFKSVGVDSLISRNACFYSIEEIEIGSNVRIDDFCILSGKIKVGSFIHISAYCALYGNWGIELKDYSGLSPRCTILSSTDDFSGNYLIGPMVDSRHTNVQGGRVIIEKYVQIGAGCVILPNIIIKEGAVTGALTLINKDLESWGIYAGIPAKRIMDRSKDLLTNI